MAVLLVSGFGDAFAAQSKKRSSGGPNPRYASLVMDAQTGVILSESHADKSLHPASLVKMMTLLMVFDALENNTLRLSDPVKISNHAARMSPSKLHLPVGSNIKVEDAIYAVVTKSANDVSAALGEKLGGTESQFAAMMTRRAQQIGMTRTRFMNASGLHHPQQVTTARDMAKLARYIYYTYPQYYPYFSTRQFTYKGTTYNNHNHLMKTYRGMDGFKTGYIVPAGFNLVASAKRGNTRLIGVVFGGRSTATRNAEMAKILDAGFANINTIMAQRGGTGAPVQVAYNAPSTASSSANVLVPTRKPEMNTDLSGETQTINGVISQGDNDPAADTRPARPVGVATPRALQATISPAQATAAYTPTKTISADGWAIQIGAFSSRVKTDEALRTARAKLPADLKRSEAVIVPLKTASGWVFRGRLSGYNKVEAQRACKYIQECLTVSPQAY